MKSLGDFKEIKELQKQLEIKEKQLFMLKRQVSVLNVVNRELVRENEALSKYNSIFLEKLSNGIRW